MEHLHFRDCRKSPLGFSAKLRQSAAAHKEYANGVLLARLRPDMYFLSGTEGELPVRAREATLGCALTENVFGLHFPLARKTLRGFFDTLRDR